VNPHMTAFAHRLDAADPVLFVLHQPQLEGPSVRRSPPLPNGLGEALDLVCAPGTCGAAFGPARQAGGGTQTTPCTLAQRASVGSTDVPLRYAADRCHSVRLSPSTRERVPQPLGGRGWGASRAVPIGRSASRCRTRPHAGSIDSSSGPPPCVPAPGRSLSTPCPNRWDRPAPIAGRSRSVSSSPRPAAFPRDERSRSPVHTSTSTPRTRPGPIGEPDGAPRRARPRPGR
jgi:hypothetical protein